MLERIPEEKINEIRQSVDILDVVSEYVQLKRQGKNYFGLCPFHGEHTASFSVSQDKQIYHCFGCGAGGNAFSFVMDIEGVTFLDSVLKLAEKANIQLDLKADIKKEHSPITLEKQQMLEAHSLLSKFYHHLLVNTKDGQHALEYLLQRGFTEQSIAKFQIGYSLNSWDFTVKFLTKRGFPSELIERAGLIIKREKEDGYFDRFRNRIMFPISDHKGNVIAFSGRALNNDQPKYLNSPETDLFNKSKVLFNFHRARPAIKKMEHVVLFEGFSDVISADRAGVENGIATMGTALTEHHIAMIKRHTEFVTICYDSDSAGIEATFKVANMLSESGCTIGIAKMPDGMDPDDYIRNIGEESFRNKVIASTMTFISFKMQYFRRGKNLQNEGDRLQYIEKVLNEISKLPKVIERDHYLRILANEFSLSLDALKQQQKQMYFAQKKNGETTNHLRSQQKSLLLLQQDKTLKPAYYNAERRLIAHMLKSADVTFKVQQMLEGQTFNIDEHQAIITYLYAYYEDGRESDSNAFLTFLPDDKLRRIVAEIEMMTISEELNERELLDYIKQVLNYQKMLKIKEMVAQEKEAEQQRDYVNAAKIAQEILILRKSL